MIATYTAVHVLSPELVAQLQAHEQESGTSVACLHMRECWRCNFGCDGAWRQRV